MRRFAALDQRWCKLPQPWRSTYDPRPFAALPAIANHCEKCFENIAVWQEITNHQNDEP